MDWEQLRQFEITRISVLKGRTVESLSPEELEAVTPWMQKVKERWTELDNEIRLHYAALRQARELAGIQRVSVPVTDLPQQSLKLALAPLSSTSQVREIGMMPASQQSELVSTDVRFAEGFPVEHGRAAGSPAGVSSLALTASEPDRRLAVFQHICEEIRRATSLPQALLIKAQAENMQLGALLNGDKEARRRYAAARLAAVQRIGELLGDLEKASLGHDEMGRFIVSEKPSPTSFPSVVSRDGTDFSAVASQPEVRKSKSVILKENGISTSTANRYERLAGPSKPEIREAVHRASDQYFSEQLEKGEMPKGGELLEVVETASGLPSTPTLTPMQKRACAFLRWVRKIGKELDQYRGAGLADYAKQTDAQSIAELRKILTEFDARFRERFPPS
jgi:hypothetical protein